MMSKFFPIFLVLASLLGGNESENVCDELGLEIYGACQNRSSSWKILMFIPAVLLNIFTISVAYAREWEKERVTGISLYPIIPFLAGACQNRSSSWKILMFIPAVLLNIFTISVADAREWKKKRVAGISLYPIIPFLAGACQNRSSSWKILMFIPAVLLNIFTISVADAREWKKKRVAGISLYPIIPFLAGACQNRSSSWKILMFIPAVLLNIFTISVAYAREWEKERVTGISLYPIIPFLAGACQNRSSSWKILMFIPAVLLNIFTISVADAREWKKKRVAGISLYPIIPFLAGACQNRSSSWKILMFIPAVLLNIITISVAYTRGWKKKRVTGISLYPIIPFLAEQTVSKKDAALIVERHNVYRQAIMDGVVPDEPKGRNIILLKWDDDLARTAQEVANTCDFRHQVCLDRRWRYKVGQNLYRTEQPFYEPNNGNWTRAVELWFLEHKMYLYGPISTDYEKTGHYTQLVWDKTKYVGCGFASYDNDRDTMNDIAEMYVCHYGPGGNRYNRYPYQLAREGKNRKDKDTDDDYDDDYKWFRYYQSRNAKKQH